MDPPGRHVAMVACHEFLDLDRAGIVLEVQPEPSVGNVDRFVLDQVALERQPPARLDDEDLADVSIGVGPDQFMAPRLLDPPGVGSLAAHSPRTNRSPAVNIASWIASVVASV